MESDDVLRLQMSIIVTMENTSKEFEENTQDLLDHLSIIYVATDKSESSGMAESLTFSVKICFDSPASSFCIIYLRDHGLHCCNPRQRDFAFIVNTLQ